MVSQISTMLSKDKDSMSHLIQAVGDKSTLLSALKVLFPCCQISTKICKTLATKQNIGVLVNVLNNELSSSASPHDDPESEVG